MGRYKYEGRVRWKVDASKRSEGGEERTLTLLESVGEKLEDPSHSIDLLDDSTSNEDGADLDGASEDLGSRIGGESGSESGGDGSLMLLEEEGSFEVRIGRESERLRRKKKGLMVSSR